MISKQEADEKVKGKWIRAMLIFEVIAVSEEATMKALEQHLGKLDRDDRVKLYEKDVSDIIKIENPTPRIKEAYSAHAETGLITNSFQKLMQIVIEYGPSALELLEPGRIEIPIGDAQSMLNSISQVMHQFAAAGVGGIVIARKQ